jgi:uncharacterized protein HemX
MAILVSIVLFGALFVGAGGLFWMRIRAEQDARRMAVEAQYREQVARELAEEAVRMAVEARDAEQEKHHRAEAVSAATDVAPIEGNEPTPAE